MKRLIDLIFAIIAIILFFPFGLIICLILRFTGEREMFYRQQRAGRNNEDFGLLKYVTMMKNSSDLPGGNITAQNDPRVLPFGKFLRKAKLNEVPQIWNILVGDMSVVGPRPLTRDNYELIPEEIRKQTQVLKPGLTGVGSLIFRDEEGFIHRSGMAPRDFYREQIGPFKGELELWYLKHRSTLLDLKIILLTAWVVLFPNSDLPQRWLPGLPTHPLFSPESTPAESAGGSASA